MLDNALERGRELWNTHKYKILAATSFLAAGYFAFKFIQEEGEPTKWSSFVEAIRQHHVTEVVVDGDAVFFRSDSSQWFKAYLNVFQPGVIWNLVKYHSAHTGTQTSSSQRRRTSFPEKYSPFLGPA